MLPLAGSLVDTAMRWQSDVSVIINSDIILTQSLPDVIAKTRLQFPEFFITGARYDLCCLVLMLKVGHFTSFFSWLAMTSQICLRFTSPPVKISTSQPSSVMSSLKESCTRQAALYVHCIMYCFLISSHTPMTSSSLRLAGADA